jgi:hypothetical protein
MTTTRIRPLDPPYSPPVTAALEQVMPSGVAPLLLFRSLAVNERVRRLRHFAAGCSDSQHHAVPAGAGYEPRMAFQSRLTSAALSNRRGTEVGRFDCAVSVLAVSIS